MSEIWSIAVTRDGVSVSSLDEKGGRRGSYMRWPLMRCRNLPALGSEDVYRMVAAGLGRLMNTGDSLPEAICLCSPDGETASFVGREGQFGSPVWFDAPLNVLRHDVPGMYAGDESLTSVFRNSVMRRFQQDDVLFGEQEKYGIWTLGAVVSHALTGRPWNACVPRGVPDGYPGGGFSDDMRDMMYQAMGVERSLCSGVCRTGFAAASLERKNLEKLSTYCGADLVRLAGIPLFDMGCCDGAAAYACAASPLSWAVRIGGGVRAGWNAGSSALSAYEIQVDDGERQDGDGTNGGHSEGVKSLMEDGGEDGKHDGLDCDEALSVDEWTRLFCSRLHPDALSYLGKTLLSCRYVLEHAMSPVMEACFSGLRNGEGCVSFSALKDAGTGSHGLHACCTSNGWQIIGMTSAHQCNHLARALFEGEMYAVRQWRESVCPQGMGPVRMMKSELWPEECVQWAADILNQEVIYIQETPAALASFGAALLLMRELDMMDGKPGLSAQIVMPSERAAYYETHYRIHCMLRNG